MLYIRVKSDNSVDLAGTEATDEMLADGYKPYDGAVPEKSNVSWMMWDAETNTIVENTDKRVQDELAVIRRKRDQLLSDTDWVTFKSIETGTPVDAAWVAYRNALRDLPGAYVVGQPTVWPTPPGGLRHHNETNPEPPPEPPADYGDATSR